MRKITILGSTGSIGRQTLDVISSHPDLYQVEGLAAGNNTDLLLEQIKRFHPKKVSVADRSARDKLRIQIDAGIEVYYGHDGLLELASATDADFVMNAVVGSQGLSPTLKAIEAGKHIGIANKETLVAAGHIVTAAARQKGVHLMPVDSEHSAIFQCLNGESMKEIKKIVLTASGGSFRDRSRDQLKSVSVQDALAHPNWSMGSKITIDCATMVNKGLEVIEAHWLFAIPYKQIEVLLHPQSIIHSMVEFCDRSVVAQMGVPNMRVPIQYALSYPQRLKNDEESLDLVKLAQLDFAEMDMERFPCLRMAMDSGRAGGSLPAVFNAANEVAVERFLRGEISFLFIEQVIDRTLQAHTPIATPSLTEILEVEKWARSYAFGVLE